MDEHKGDANKLCYVA